MTTQRRRRGNLFSGFLRRCLALAQSRRSTHQATTPLADAITQSAWPAQVDPLDANVVLRALNAISQGVLIAGPDGLILSANQTFTRMTGYTLRDVLGRTCSMLQGPKTDPQTVARIRDAMAKEITFSGDLINYRKDGEWFWNSLIINPVHDEGGQLTHFIGILRDVTARKAAEAAHAASEQRYRHLIEHIPAGVVVHDATSAILLANSAAATLLGLSIEQLRGREAIDPYWHFTHEDGTPLPRDAFPVSRVLSSRQAIRNYVVGIVTHQDAPCVWVICNGYPVFNEQGELTEVVVSFVDFTELKQAEQALQKSEERLRLVLHGSNDAPWDRDLATDTVYYSPRWWEMIGYAIDEQPVTSQLWLSLIHPDDVANVTATFNQVLADSSVNAYEIEFRFKHRAGHDVPVLSRAFVLRDDTGRAIRVSGTNTDLTERKRTEQRIHQLAFYDGLTNLPNRRLLTEQLRLALANNVRNQEQGALLFIDLDNFKTLNDTLGHEMGDQLLAQVANRLRQSVREVDVVARLGGDEFVVMLENLSPNTDAAAIEAEVIGQRILTHLGAPYTLMDREYISTPSIGITLFDDHANGVDGLLKQADLAMYQAKAAGRNTLRFFDASMQAAVDQRVAMEHDLRDGLHRNELILHYQPQVNEFGQIIGAEGLVRWMHPERGLVSPGAFIPLAESTGLILPLGNWVLQLACHQLVAWAADPALEKLTLAVNVSAQQFHTPDFVDQVVAILDRTGANPARLKLELTESLLAENIDDIIAKMSALKHLGVGFSLDDFGTGYSSLSYLKRLPLDQLKIDQSFVRDVLTDPNDATIARIIITLAAELGLVVIAEGVETEGQRQFLNTHGCLAYQGYLFSKPVSAQSFESLFRQERPAAVR
ncbi:MAG: EAL domain-containing protein [Burkholderiales bacterium]|nr:EAL domain-containing protein [Burkholderiales bacterium]